MVYIEISQILSVYSVFIRASKDEGFVEQVKKNPEWEEEDDEKRGAHTGTQARSHTQTRRHAGTQARARPGTEPRADTRAWCIAPWGDPPCPSPARWARGVKVNILFAF